MRCIEKTSIGCHFVGAALPHPDTRSRTGLIAGFFGRMGKPMPQVTVPDYYERLNATTKKFIEERGIHPFSEADDFDFDAWLAEKKYPKWRKDQLSIINNEIVDMFERNDAGELKNFKIKLFCKDEDYIDFKLNRGIYAREDVAKVFFGPYIAAIEAILYEQPEFIKHVPVARRGEYIMDMLYRDGGKYIQTDYSSYECHFDPQRMKNCEFVLYEHMLGNSPRGKFAVDIMSEVFMGNNRVFSKHFEAVVLACRMSGEMNTSLGNGFSNLMMMREVCESNNFDCIGVVEGDDGLFVFGDMHPTTQDFVDRGCRIKLEVFRELSLASFCGLIFDESDRQVITDPLDILCSTGYTTKTYAFSKPSKKLALLRCKGLSLLHQYPSCPIVSEYARYILRCTKHIDTRSLVEKSRSFSLWEREQYMDAIKDKSYQSALEIGVNTRALVEEAYGIPFESQLRLENYFKSTNVIKPIEDPFILYLISERCPSWIEYWNTFRVECDPYIVWN